MYIIKGIDAFVTTYNETAGDWSGGEFIKENPYNDELLTLTEESLTESISDMLDVDIDFKHMHTQDNMIAVSIVENGEGYPDEDGSFLVDYVFAVSMVSNVDVDEVLKEGNDQNV